MTEFTAEQVGEVLLKYIINNPYIPHKPFKRQAVFLVLSDLEALFGGAAGGGKSDALLMAALMFAEVPGYNAILFRKSYTDLNLPEAIMARSHEWLQGTAAKWNGTDYRWTFPSGATLSFGYLNHEKDRYRYQSSAYQFIGFDELTQFPIDNYLYMFSRLRKLEAMEVPLRMRGGTNPGGVGNDWVYDRFIGNKDRIFVPSKLTDNPHIDQDEYRAALSNLDETTRLQLEEGQWVTDPAGKPFQPEYWQNQNRFLPFAKGPSSVGRWISWDTALEDKAKSAYSAAVVFDLTSEYRLKVVDTFRERLTFPDLPDAMADLFYKWDRDEKMRGVIIEGQASGKPAIQTLRRSADDRLAKSIIEFSPKGSKEERGSRAGLWCKRGMVMLPYPGEESDWLDTFTRELYSFPEVTYKDQVDAFAQGIIFLENYLVTGWHGHQARVRTQNPLETRLKRLQANRRQSSYYT